MASERIFIDMLPQKQMTAQGERLFLGTQEAQNRFRQVLEDYYGSREYGMLIQAAIHISPNSTLSADTLASMRPIAVLQQFIEQEHVAV